VSFLALSTSPGVPQVGGWVIDYEGLTLATVRNAGHMVPYVQPERAYHLLGMFLYGKDAEDAGKGQQEL
jgi:carboxypeptidase C (cathepsin A)